MNDSLLILVEEWDSVQLSLYIERLEMRVNELNALIKELKKARRNKIRRKPVDTGSPRGGK